jgi:hypothetical protein
MNAFRCAHSIGLFFLLAPLWPGTHGQGKDKDTSVILERFKVARHGEALLLPVTWNGKTFQFLLDTGASGALYDSSLPLGAAKRKKKVDSAGGPIELQFFDAPDAKVGNLTLRTAEEVVGFDQGKVREITGHEIYGVVGMDFLEKHVVEIDCDEGEVRFLQAVGRNAGTPFGLEFRDGCPHVDVSVQNLGNTRFLVDTGFISSDSGTLTPELLTKLQKKGAVRIVGQSYAETLAGTKISRIAQGKKLSLGEFAIADPVIGEGPHNMVGMGLLSRFKVTFDFPNKVMYLRKGKRFNTPDLWDISGLHLLRRKEETIVHSVDKGSAAENRGIKAGDKITKVGDRNAGVLSLFDLRQLCRQPDTTLNLIIEREGQPFTAYVELKR